MAPNDGTHLLSWTVSSYVGKYVVTELVNNNIISISGETDSDGFYHTVSMTALCRIKADEHAFVRTTSFGTENVIYSYRQYPRTSFLGMLVLAE